MHNAFCLVFFVMIGLYEKQATVCVDTRQGKSLLLTIWNSWSVFVLSTNFSILFVRFSKIHTFEKPNDERALRLMNACATSMLEKFPDIVFAYGVSDEYRYNIFSWNFQFEFFQSP